MNLDLPVPKKKKHQLDEAAVNAFPVNTIPDDGSFGDKQFKGIFTGLNVEIVDEVSIKTIYENGRFGSGTQTKTCPKICYVDQRIRNVTQQQLEQKLAWRTQFGNENPNKVMVKLLSPPETMETDEPQLQEDPFPIEEALALLLEEAFFLHHALRCLRIFDFDETNEFTTDELIEKFCDLDPRFIERYVAYQYYRSKNWVPKSGLKFGGDFLLYDKGPEFSHASYVVLVGDNDVNQSHLDVQSNYRVSDTTGKCIIIFKVTRPEGLEYSNRLECIRRINEFKVTEVIPKRFQFNCMKTSEDSSSKL